MMAEIYIARDDLAALDGVVARVPLPVQGPPLIQAMGEHLHGLAKAARGRHAAALEHFTAAIDLGDGLGPCLALWVRAAIESAARAGDLAYAAALAEDALARARSYGAPRTIGAVLRRAALAQPQYAGAAAMLREAISLLQDHEGRYEAALALADLAELALGPAAGGAGPDGRRSEGLAAARRALVLANRIGAARVARRMAALLATQEPSLPLLAENPADRLTPAEFRVCSLAAKGLTNRQIAAELFITIKAVEWHLSRSFAKLAISSRKELSAALGQRD
jgi:DNA-binding NarL/FixJ family response regulator